MKIPLLFLLVFLVASCESSHKQQELTSSLMHLKKKLQDLGATLKKSKFDRSLNSIRAKFEKLQNEPTAFNLNSFAQGLTFNVTLLDAVDRLDVLSEIFQRFNQLAKDIEMAFIKPNKDLQVLAKQLGKDFLLIRKQIFDSLRQSQEKLRSYVKGRLEKSRKERS